MNFHELGQVKQPPSYEECVKGAASMNNIPGMAQQQDNNPFRGYVMNDQGQQQLHHQGNVVHQRQQSMPASFSPASQATMSPPSHLTPPHSSPQYVTSPHSQTPSVTSPGKMRPALPTSPTHMAALRQATASSGFEFPPVTT